MTVRSYWEDDIFLVEMSGKLMGGPDSESIHSGIKDVVEHGCRKVVLDLSHVDWLNSWGVGLLVSAFTTLKSQGGQLVLSGSSPKVMTVFRMTRFDSVFQFSPDVPSATKLLAGKSPA